jgi:hypothetical protein
LAGIGQARRPIGRHVPIAAARADPIIELRVSYGGGNEKCEIDGTLKPKRPVKKQNVMTILQHLAALWQQGKRKILAGAIVVGKTPPLTEELLPIAVLQRYRTYGLMESDRIDPRR